MTSFAIVAAAVVAVSHGRDDGGMQQRYVKKHGAWRYDGDPKAVRHPESFVPLGRQGEATAVFARDAGPPAGVRDPAILTDERSFRPRPRIR